MNKLWKAILPIILVSVVLSGGCSHRWSALVPAVASQPTVAPQVGKLAPDFQLPSLDGPVISLSDLRGKPVLINFWATWCPPCREEMPYLQQVYDEWSGKGLVILGVNLTYSKLSETPAKVKDFMQSNNLSFPVLLDTNGDVERKYNVTGIPETFLIDKNGVIQAKIIGAFPSTEAIEKELSKIMP